MTCTQCRQTVFKESTDGIANPSQFCVGEGGCVCVGFCESTVWKALTVDMTCARPPEATPMAFNDSRVALTGPLRSVAIIMVFVITVPVVVIVGASMRGAAHIQLVISVQHATSSLTSFATLWCSLPTTQRGSCTHEPDDARARLGSPRERRRWSFQAGRHCAKI